MLVLLPAADASRGSLIFSFASRSEDGCFARQPINNVRYYVVLTETRERAVGVGAAVVTVGAVSWCRAAACEHLRTSHGFDLHWTEDGDGKALVGVRVKVPSVVSVIKIEDP